MPPYAHVRLAVVLSQGGMAVRGLAGSPDPRAGPWISKRELRVAIAITA